MGNATTASIVINNYNYGRFVHTAINSALAQTYRQTEVIVVDDGSVDDSRAIIAGYGDRVRPVLKSNGGQLSALAAGITASRGDVVFFLDSDDAMVSTAVESVMPLFCDSRVVKVHWPLWLMDEWGHEIGEIRDADLPDGEFGDTVVRDGPQSVPSPPTSGNAWTRQFLERLLPAPEQVRYYKTCADEYFFNLAPLFGSIRRLTEPQSYYRLHGTSTYSARSFSERLGLELEGYVETCRVLTRFCRQLGLEAHPKAWRKHSWFHRLAAAISDIKRVVPSQELYLLADEYKWDLPEHEGRRPIPLPKPENAADAIRQIERHRSSGVRFLVFGWPAFWWLDYYGHLWRHLRTRYARVLDNDRIVAFDLASAAKRRLERRARK